MPEPGAGETGGVGTQVIDRDTAARNAEKSAKIAGRHKVASVPVSNEKGTSNKAWLEHLNAGLGLRTNSKEEQEAVREEHRKAREAQAATEEQTAASESGLPLIEDEQEPIAESTSSVDIPLVPGFSEKKAERIKAIEEKLASDTEEHPLDPNERDRLEKLQDELEAEITNSVDVPLVNDFLAKNQERLDTIEAILDRDAKEEDPDKKLKPNEKERLEKYLAALQEANPATFPSLKSFETENGDFVRKAPDTQEYEFVDANAEKQVFRFVVRNWDEEKIRAGETVTVSLPTYNTRVDEDSSVQARDSRLALQMPDMPMISIMHPGMGSDPLTPEQIKELLGDEGYAGIAKRMLSLLDSLGVTSINVTGASMGYSALYLAAEAVDYELKDGNGEKMKVNKVVIAATPPGDKNAKELIKAEIADSKRLPAAIASPFEPFAFRSNDYHRSGLMQGIGLARWLGRKFFRADPYFKGSPYTQSMANYSPEKLVKKILDTQETTSVNAITGTEDGVGSTKGWYTLIDKLRGKTNPYGDRLTHTVFPGASHVFYENPSRYAGMMEMALRS